jgi:transporter family protein
MPRWLFFSLITIVLWGLWGFLSTVATDKCNVNPYVLQAFMTGGLLPAVLVAAFSKTAWTGRNRRRGMLIAFITGLLGCLANTATYKAIGEGGPVSIVLPVAAIYPILTVLVAWAFLKERINVVQVGGIAIGVSGIVILSMAAGGGSARGFFQSLGHAFGQWWMLWTLVAMLGQAAAGVTQKLSTDDLAPEGSFVAFAVAFVPVAVVIVASASKYQLPLNVGVRGWWASTAVGLAVGFGVLASFAAYRHGKAAVVTPMTGLYPVVTTVLAVTILREPFGFLPLVGTILALGGAAAMSYEKRHLAADVDAAPGAVVATSETGTL